MAWGYECGTWASVDDEMLGAKSSFVKIVGSRGHIPLLWNAFWMVSGLNASSHACIYSLTKFFSGISCPVSSRTSSHLFENAFPSGPNIPTSKGCSLWVVCAGRQNRCMLWDNASWCIYSVRCVPWPSKMSSIGFPLVF